MHSSKADSKAIWMDGKLTAYADAQVHVLSHSLHYGTAVFEGMRAYGSPGGKTFLFRAKEHFDRFLSSMQVLGYHSRFSTEELIAATRSLISANGFRDCYVRPLAYLDDSVRGLQLPKEPRPTIAIAAWHWGRYMGEEGHQNGVRVSISSLRRADIATALPWAKLSGNYLVSVLSRLEASNRGHDECILLDQEGFVAEGSGENVFVVTNNTILTPPHSHILPGITRESVIRIARDMGYTVREEPVIRNQLYLADEVFFTGTAVEVTPIREIDYKIIGSGRAGKITRAISDRFFQIVRGEMAQYREWLTEM
jgi:branched-chain amino acid aminotransferase